MRQVFSSARIENVQAVAKLLADEGIEVRVEDGQRYRRSIRGGFSYREGGSTARASVWVVRSDDQTRARQLLHAAGLLESAAPSATRYLPPSAHAARQQSPRRRTRLRLGLLIVATVALAMWLNQFRNPGWDLPAPAPGRAAPVAIDPSLQAISTVEAVHRVPVPPALAATLASARAAEASTARLCLSVDGADPGEAALDAARATGLEAVPASACPGEAGLLRVSVSDYRTDGSGEGTVEVEVEVEVDTVPGDGPPASERLAVRRDGDHWQLVQDP